jgi:membrane carboxypeptidase/penicillin-binding protein PbpC
VNFVSCKKIVNLFRADFYLQLKQILSDVIDFAPFAFNIKFAAAASRKYHSHVKKWLSEKSAVYKGHFLEV